MISYRQRGRIDYLNDDGSTQGKEWFDVTVQKDGQRTLRARSEIYDAQILRDVVFTVDKAWRPLDCFVRLSKDGVFGGSSWFRFHDGGADCESYLSDLGRISQHWEAPAWPTIFATHAVTSDVWQMGLFDHSRSEKVQTIGNRISPSALPNGGSGPLIGHGYSGDGRPGEIDLEYVGPETIEVPAGTFKTQHFRVQRRNRVPLEIWGSGPNIIPVKLRWDLIPRTYLLAEYDEAAG